MFDGKRLTEPMAVAFGDSNHERTYANRFNVLVKACRRVGGSEERFWQVLGALGGWFLMVLRR